MAGTLNSNLISDAKLKVMYDNVPKSLRALWQGLLAQVQAFGSAKTIPNGGKSFNWLLDMAPTAGAGFANAGDVTHIGQDDSGISGDADWDTRVQPAFTLTDFFGRAEIDFRRIQIDSNDGSMLKEDVKKVREAYEQMQSVQDILFTNDSDGRYFDTVAATGSAISTLTAGDVSVRYLQWIPENVPMHVKRSGSIQSNILLVVRNKPHGAGAGTVKVYNRGSSSYTPTENDQLVPAYSVADGIYWSSWEEGSGTGTYPRNEGNNTAINPTTYPKWKGFTLDAGDADADYVKFRKLRQGLRQRVPTDFQKYTNPTKGGDMSHPCIVAMDNDVADRLRDEFQAKQRFTGELKDYDVGWGDVFYIDGIPVWPNDINPTEVMRYIDARDFAHGSTEVATLTGAVRGLWQPMSGKTKYELTLHQRSGVVCQRRQTQGKITSVKGLTTADAGLT